MEYHIITKSKRAEGLWLKAYVRRSSSHYFQLSFEHLTPLIKGILVLISPCNLLQTTPITTDTITEHPYSKRPII